MTHIYIYNIICSICAYSLLTHCNRLHVGMHVCNNTRTQYTYACYIYTSHVLANPHTPKQVQTLVQIQQSIHAAAGRCSLYAGRSASRKCKVTVAAYSVVQYCIGKIPAGRPARCPTVLLGALQGAQRLCQRFVALYDIAPALELYTPASLNAHPAQFRGLMGRSVRSSAQRPYYSSTPR